MGVIDIVTLAAIPVAITVVSSDVALHVGKSFGLNVSLNKEKFLAIFIALFSLRLVFGYVALRAIYGFSERVDTSLRSRLLRAYLNMPASNYSERNSAAFINAAQGLCAQFSFGTLGIFMRLIFEIIIVLSVLSFFAYFSLEMLVLLVAFILLIGSAYYFGIKNPAYKYGKTIGIKGAELIGLIQSAINGFKEIKVYGFAGRFVSKIEATSKDFSLANKNQLVTTAVGRSFIDFSALVFMISVIGAMYLSEVSHVEIVSFFGVFSVGMWRILPCIGQITSSLTSLAYGTYGVDVLYGDLIAYERNQDRVRIQEKTDSFYDINFNKLELKDVSFSYGNNLILKNVNLSISKGDMIGLLGPSGGGKTTLAELIIGLLKPSSGITMLNGFDVSTMPDEHRFKCFAYLPQDGFIYSGTIFENITLGLSVPNDSIKIYEAARKSQLTSLIDRGSDGLNLNCGEDGAKLSGGQRQRVSIARAIYHDKQVIIFDESTSALDKVTEQEFLAELVQLNRIGVTVIIIAHKFNTLRHCNRHVLVMDRGAEEISHELTRKYFQDEKLVDQNN
jgi:ABC-type bacteriocin/lantibiotic exporter with double-glycine peptidase domain